MKPTRKVLTMALLLAALLSCLLVSVSAAEAPDWEEQGQVELTVENDKLVLDVVELFDSDQTAFVAAYTPQGQFIKLVKSVIPAGEQTVIIDPEWEDLEDCCVKVIVAEDEETMAPACIPVKNFSEKVPVQDVQNEYLYGYFIEDTDTAQEESEGDSVGHRYYYDVVNFNGMAGTTKPVTQQIGNQDLWNSLSQRNDGMFFEPVTIGTLARYTVNEKGEVDAIVPGTKAPGGVYLEKGTAEIIGADVTTDENTQFMVRTYDWITGEYAHRVYVGYNGLPKAVFGGKEREGYNQNILYLTNDAGIATHVFVDVSECSEEKSFFVTGNGDGVTVDPVWNIYTAEMKDGTGCCIATFEELNVGMYYAEVVKTDALTDENLPVYIVPGEVFAEEWTGELDCFGRPIAQWTSLGWGAVHGETYTADFYCACSMEGDLEDAMQGCEISSVTTYRNGSFVPTANTLEQASKWTGAGVQTEVFYNWQTGAVIVVVIDTNIAQVCSVRKQPATVTLNNGYTIPNTLGLMVDDYVMYQECAGPIASGNMDPGHHEDAVVATIHTATTSMTKYLHNVWVAKPSVETVIFASRGVNGSDWLSTSYFQTASRTFEYAANFGNVIKAGGASASDLISLFFFGDNIYDIYLDKYGYVMWWEEHIEEPEYGYGYIVEGSHDFFDTVVNGVRVTERFFDMIDFNDGHSVRVPVAEEVWRATAEAETGTLVRYQIDKEGLVEGAGYGTTVAGGYVMPGAAAIFGATDASGRQILANNKTQYMIRTYNFVTGEYSYEFYTGYRNLPKNLLGYEWANDSNSNNGVTLQYLTAAAIDPDADARIATHVFIDATYAGTEETFYLLSHESIDQNSLYPFINDYDIYAALIDGERVFLAIPDDDWNLERLEKGLYTARMHLTEAITIHGLPIYVVMEAVQPVKWDVISLDHGLLTVDQIMDALVIPGADHVQLADEAVINVFYNNVDSPYDNEETIYEIFSGETRDADFNAIFSKDDWTTVEVYAEYEEVSTFGGTLYEVTNLWIKLSGRFLS